MRYKENWEETKEHLKAWWKRESIGRPLLRIEAKRSKPVEELEPEKEYVSPADKYLNIEQNLTWRRNYSRTHRYMAEAFPFEQLFVVPCAMALFQGCEPNFSWETAWHDECVKTTWQEFGPLKLDPENKWWKLHLERLKAAKQAAGDDRLIAVPDLLENVDVLSLMRGQEKFIYDLMDEPEVMKEYLNQLDELFFRYYDPVYDIVKDKDGGSCCVFFSLWSDGRIGKMQCDFSALMSPGQFREFVVPSMVKQCEGYKNILYHLDGACAIKHLDALVEIDRIDAIQWMPGAGAPGTLDECWYPVYDKIRSANKGIWIHIEDHEMKDAVEGVSKLVKRYGPAGLYVAFPEMTEEDAGQLLKKAERDWK